MKKYSLLLLGAMVLELLCSRLVHSEPVPAALPPPAKASSAKNPRGPWDPVLGEGVRAGLARGRLRTTTERLSRAGISPETGRLILAPAFDAAMQGLPWESVLAKVDEGLLKKVGPEALTAAGRGRADSLTKARRLVAGILGTPLSRENQALVPASALALESGVTETVLVDVLKHGKGKPVAQLRPVVEAGEALQLAGIESDAVEALMGDCLAKNLRRQEVLRVVRFAVEKKRQGMAGMAIRQALWDATAKGNKIPAPEPRPLAPPLPDGQPPKPLN